jgi:predicted DNA-binding transcriptional regulator YafY
MCRTPGFWSREFLCTGPFLLSGPFVLMPASTLEPFRALLREGHALTQADIAGRLDISKRQARGLITQLRTDGLPIQEDRRGRSKEYRLPPEEQSTGVLLSLSEREALAVVLAAAAVKSGSVPIPSSNELQSAFDQITEALSGQVVTFEPRSLQRQLHVRHTGSVKVDGDLFLELLGAIPNRQRLSMD